MGQDEKKNRFSWEHDEEEQEKSGPSIVDEVVDKDEKNEIKDDKSDRNNLIEFLKYPKNKRRLVEYIEKAYKVIEEEDVERVIALAEYEHKSELEGATPYHRPGHIGALTYEFLNMTGVESAYASALQHTKASLTKTTHQRVNEINTILRGVGGFNRQIKSSFSRSAVLYLEQDDPKYKHRDRIVFTVNLADFELKNPVNDAARKDITEDGRTHQRLSWDEAVNTLTEIISNTGMKPKYVRNNKNSCSLMMRQYLLREGVKQPDEYFEFSLVHIRDEIRRSMKKDHEERIDRFKQDIAELREERNKFWVKRSKVKWKQIGDEIKCVESDLEFYLATHPDPEEMDSGYVFSIYVNTLKDYGMTKDKMQFIMTKFILATSKVAHDKSMDEQFSNGFHKEGSGEHHDEITETVEVMKVEELPKKVG